MSNGAESPAVRVPKAALAAFSYALYEGGLHLGRLASPTLRELENASSP